MNALHDPKGLIREAYRIEGITLGECRSIFLDWALSLPDGVEPRGPIKEAQELASRAFGSKQTFFATNGTSTCNKIVVQALVRPGDIVLVDRDCHKSHHYGMVLAGANVVYTESYPLQRGFDAGGFTCMTDT